MAEQDRTIVAWRAWYTDKRIFESTTTRWEDLPAHGALGFRLYYSNGEGRIMGGTDLYWKDGDIYAHDDVPSAIIRPELEESGMVKRGRWTTDPEMGWARDAIRGASEPPD
jgi:hypothetical protein